MNEEKFLVLVENFLKINNELNQINRIPLKLPNGLILSTSALHLIEAIGKHPTSNVTELSEILGVTKGAVSQQIPRLEKLNLISKYRVEENKKEVFFKLTKAGVELFEYHQQLHQELYRGLSKDLANLSVEDVEIINEMLTKVSKSMMNYQKKLRL